MVRERRMLDEERGRRLAGAHHGMRDEPAQEGQVRRHALDLGLGAGRRASRERILARRPVCDQLRDQRVVSDADLVALLDTRVDPNVFGQPQPRQAAGLREERARVLRVEPHLDRVSRGSGRASTGSPAAIRSCGLDEIDSGDELGDGVLDLDARVQLEEPELSPSTMNSAVPAFS